MSLSNLDWIQYRPSPSTSIWIRTDKHYKIVLSDIIPKKEKQKGRKFSVSFFKNRTFPSKQRPEWGFVYTYYLNQHSNATRKVTAWMNKYGLIKPKKKKNDLGLDEIMRGLILW